MALARVALAAPLALDLDWQSPPGCPDRTTVHRYVQQMLRQDQTATSSLVARGGVTRIAGDRWLADVTLRSGSGVESTRSFDGPTCESVSRAAALVMALTMHPSQPPPSLDAAPNRDTRAPERSIKGRFARPAVAPALITDVGSTPLPTFGGALAAGWSPVGGVRWETFVAYWASRTGTVADRPRLGADVSLAALGLRGCYPLVDAVVSLAPCVGGGLDWFRASGFGAAMTRNASAWTANLEMSGLIMWNFNEFASIRLGVSAVVPLTRPEFVIDSPGTAGVIYRRALVAFRGTAGMELHF
jgi:hypothetical protein